MGKGKKKGGGGSKGGKGAKALKRSNYQPVEVRDVNELWVKINFKVGRVEHRYALSSNSSFIAANIFCFSSSIGLS